MEHTTIKQPNAVLDRLKLRAQKKAIRKAEARRVRYKKTFKRIVYWVAGLVVVIGGGWWLISATGPKGLDYSQAIPILGRDHVAEGTTYPSYNSNPPTSGPHYPNPANTGFYDRELPDEQLVHNLEHSQIWIAYRQNLSPDIVKRLKGFAGGNVIVTLRSKNDTDIALAAWGRLDAFNVENGELPSQRISDFISRYKNRGPENPNLPAHFRQ